MEGTVFPLSWYMRCVIIVCIHVCVCVCALSGLSLCTAANGRDRVSFELVHEVRAFCVNLCVCVCVEWPI